MMRPMNEMVQQVQPETAAEHVRNAVANAGTANTKSRARCRLALAAIGTRRVDGGR